jgi:hypothetical protein
MEREFEFKLEGVDFSIVKPSGPLKANINFMIRQVSMQ